jgi:XTP/dITP diphosphohydrolase/tetrapyrrole methylase family protein/MazG family protein
MKSLVALKQTMARLRAPGGCPWDREQTHHSLTRYLIEECAELLDAIDREDFPHMKEELGDVLLQVVFHACIAEENGLFDLDAVAADINDKLIRRHPHVFGADSLETSEAVLARWEQIKQAEKAAAGRPETTKLKPLPPALPALLFANEVFKQIEKRALLAVAPVDTQAIATKAEGLDEASAGRQLFELAAACRKAGIDPEAALRRHTRGVIDAVEKA